MREPAETGISTGFPAFDDALADRGWPIGGLVELLCEDCGIGELRLLSHALADSQRQDRRAIAWIDPPYLPYAPALEAVGIDPDRVILIHPSDEDGMPAAEMREVAHRGKTLARAGADADRKQSARPCKRAFSRVHEGTALARTTPSAEVRKAPLLEKAYGRKASRTDALWAFEQACASGACVAVLGWLDDRKLRFAEIRRLQFAAKKGRTWANLFRPANVATEASPAELRLRLRPLAEDRIAIDIIKRRSGWPTSVELTLDSLLTQRRKRWMDQLARWRAMCGPHVPQATVQDSR